MVRAPTFVDRDEVGRRDRGALEPVRPVGVQLRRRDVEREGDVLAEARSPALPTASATASMAAELLPSRGANPPSSPTAVEAPLAFRIPFSAW